MLSYSMIYGLVVSFFEDCWRVGGIWRIECI